MNVDESKVPEGATHWAEDRRCYSTGGVQFYRQIDGTWSYWGEALGSGWRQCLGPCRAVLPLPQPKSLKWNGEGLPPVGAVCEHFGTADHTNWIEVKVIGHGHVRHHDVAFFEYMTGTKGYTVSYSTHTNFRPLRTPEQIAAEEHQAAISELAADTDWILTKEACEAVLAAGYHKQVKP